MQAVDWPEPLLASAFMQEADHMWGTEAGRAEVRRWMQVIGKVSGFVEGKLWTVASLREHYRQWDEWTAAEEALKISKGEKREALTQDRHLRSIEQKELSRRWHAAVAQRKAAVDASKKLVDAERDRHKALIADWDAYVEAVKMGHVTPADIAAGS